MKLKKFNVLLFQKKLVSKHVQSWQNPIHIVALAGSCILATASIVSAQTSGNPLDKIQFPLANIDSNGLAGKESGKVSVAYEFCIPSQYQDAVKTIDPSLKFSRSPGRIRCQSDQDQLLCIGETHQLHWRAKLFNLARLPYVEKIVRFWGE